MTTSTPDSGLGKLDKPRCPKCQSTEIRYRIIDNTLGCRGCGHRWPKPQPV